MNRAPRLARRIRAALTALLLAVTSLVATSRAHADAPPTLDDANRAFGEGRYAEAAHDFEAILAARGYSAPVLFDLGNARLRDGKPVAAILAYERARLLAPRDPAILANLASARAVASTPDVRGFATRAVHVLTLDDWTWLGAGAFWIGVAALGAAYVARRGRPLLVLLASSAAVAASTAAACTLVASRELDHGLIMQPAPVLVSPFASAQTDFALPAGADVQLGRSRDGYVFVHDAQGRTGWVERAQVEPLVPPAT